MNTALLHILSPYQQIDERKPPEAITVQCNATAYYLQHDEELLVLTVLCIILNKNLVLSSLQYSIDLCLVPISDPQINLL